MIEIKIWFPIATTEAQIIVEVEDAFDVSDFSVLSHIVANRADGIYEDLVQGKSEEEIKEWWGFGLDSFEFFIDSKVDGVNNDIGWLVDMKNSKHYKGAK